MAEDRHTSDQHAAGGSTPAPRDAGAHGPDDLSRGEFLTKASIGVGAVMAGLIAAPVAGLALAPAVATPDFEPVLLGKVDDFTEGTFVKVVLEPGKDERGSYVRKRVAFVRRNAEARDDKLAPKGQGKYSVISNRCAHLGCPVTESGGTFVCPCHGGAYDSNGDRTAGPPVRPLDRFRWEERGDELWATGEYSLKVVDGRGEAVAIRGPGQHSGGPSGLLYPIQPGQF